MNLDVRGYLKEAGPERIKGTGGNNEGEDQIVLLFAFTGKWETEMRGFSRRIEWGKRDGVIEVGGDRSKLYKTSEV